jgi:phage-related protein
MISTIQLDGKTNVELNFLILRGSQYPVLPPTVDRKLFISARNGMRNFGADFGAKQFDFRCAINAANSLELHQRVSEIAAFLLDQYGKPRDIELILLAQPEWYYTVRLTGDTALNRIVGYGEFSLSLVADDPYAYLVEPNLDSDIILDSDIRLDGEIYGFYDLAGGLTGNIPNVGKLISRPTITITGSFTTLSISTNGKTFSFSEAMSNKTMVINGEALTVQVAGVNKLSKMSGDFIELLAGDNTVIISGTGINCDITFNVYPKFL